MAANVQSNLKLIMSDPSKLARLTISASNFYFPGHAILLRLGAPPHFRRPRVAAAARNAAAPEPDADRTRNDAAGRAAPARICHRNPADHSLLQQRQGHVDGSAVHRLQSGW